MPPRLNPLYPFHQWRMSGQPAVALGPQAGAEEQMPELTDILPIDRGAFRKAADFFSVHRQCRQGCE